GVVPVIGDYNTVMWILHRDLGGEMAVTDERGATVRLRFVGLLEGSIFQSELIMGQAAFLKLFPGRSGFSVLAIEAPWARAKTVAETLERSLGEYGFDATRTNERLAAFAVIENTYLSVFQLLGGLGLLLGTLGLGAIMLRNVLERRGELALLQALGFRRRALAVLVLAENAFLLVAGVTCGAGAGLLSVAPHLAGGGGDVPWGGLVLLLAAVVAAGIGAGAWAVRVAVRTPMLEALRAE
ncbi:MAG: ABC transporter permease, partial [Verrucomicrobia bacterium]|nr:ABC transporter permease [Verrucomicrobiota bacterium]